MKDTLPRQHGAWSIMIASVIVGGGAGCGFNLYHFILLLLGVFSIGVRYNFFRWFKQRRREWIKWGGMYFLLFLGLSFFILYKFPILIILAFPGVLLFVVTFVITLTQGELSPLSESFGVLLLSFFVPTSYVISCGEMNLLSVFLWFLSLCFFLSSIFRVRYLVRLRMRGKGGVKENLPSTIYHLLIVILFFYLYIQELVPLYYPLSLVHVLFASFVLPLIAPPSSVKRVGYLEIVYTIVFIGILVFWE